METVRTQNSRILALENLRKDLGIEENFVHALRQVASEISGVFVGRRTQDSPIDRRWSFGDGRVARGRRNALGVLSPLVEVFAKVLSADRFH